MVSTATTRNRLEKQGSGENNNTWGTRFNTNFADLNDFALDGMTSFTLSGLKTLSSNDYAADEARARFLNVTSGTGGTVTIPNLEKVYLVRNATSGSVIFTTGSGTTATVLTGQVQWVVCIAGNVVYASDWLAQSASGTAALVDIMTTAQFWANTATKVVSTDQVWAAADYVTLTDAATIALDMSTFINGTVTLGGNRTLGNPTNTKNGQSGCIEVLQDGTGGRTLAFASNWKFPGGSAPTVSAAASARDTIYYRVRSATIIVASIEKAIA